MRAAGRNGAAATGRESRRPEARPSTSAIRKGIVGRRRCPGSGNSSPVVWDDAVLLTTELADADPPTAGACCVSIAATGGCCGRPTPGRPADEPTPRTATPRPAWPPTANASSPSSAALGLFCYDFSGKPQWHVDFGQMDHMWGPASSPVLYGETVIQLCDYEGDSFIAAFDKADGPAGVADAPRQPGKLEHAGLRRGRSRRPATHRDDRSRRQRACTQVIAYDPANGQELWRVGDTTDLVTPLPLVCNGLVYCASGRNGPILAIRPGGSGDVTATHVVWKTSRGGPYIPSGVCYRNRLYLIGDGGPLCCYDPGDGRLVWQTRLGGPFTSSLIAADGRIYAINERGTVYVFAAGDSFELLATNQMHSPCLATPAVADGELFLRTKTDLYCFPEASKEEGGRGKGEGGDSGRRSVVSGQ